MEQYVYWYWSHQTASLPQLAEQLIHHTPMLLTHNHCTVHQSALWQYKVWQCIIWCGSIKCGISIYSVAGTWTKLKPANNRLTAAIHHPPHTVLKDNSTQLCSQDSVATQESTIALTKMESECWLASLVAAAAAVAAHKLRTCVCQIHIVATDLNPSIDFDQIWWWVGFPVSSPKQEIKIKCWQLTSKIHLITFQTMPWGKL